MTYQEFKDWCVVNKNKAAIAVSFVLVFLVGFGMGSYKKGSTMQMPLQNNYTTNEKEKTEPKKPAANGGEGTQVLGAAFEKASTSPPSLGNCVVKGNISATGGKIYHVVGGASYKIVKPEQCFATEAEAQAAGFRKSAR